MLSKLPANIKYRRPRSPAVGTHVSGCGAISAIQLRFAVRVATLVACDLISTSSQALGIHHTFLHYCWTLGVDSSFIDLPRRPGQLAVVSRDIRNVSNIHPTLVKTDQQSAYISNMSITEIAGVDETETRIQHLLARAREVTRTNAIETALPASNFAGSQGLPRTEITESTHFGVVEVASRRVFHQFIVSSNSLLGEVC